MRRLGAEISACPNAATSITDTRQKSNICGNAVADTLRGKAVEGVRVLGKTRDVTSSL